MADDPGKIVTLEQVGRAMHPRYAALPSARRLPALRVDMSDLPHEIVAEISWLVGDYLAGVEEPLSIDLGSPLTDVGLEVVERPAVAKRTRRGKKLEKIEREAAIPLIRLLEGRGKS